MRNGQNKQRMRNRNNGHNNNRRSQNPMTRVYDSNGPDIKIRGTAAHIAEKYLQLARDSQSSGDPVAAENYYQHAEHYFRLIAAAQEQFRQNMPQHQQQPRIESDLGDDDGEEFGNFGVEPGLPREQMQPQHQVRDQQPYQQREHQPREHQPREHQQREHGAPRDREQGFREQPREQSFRENRPQPAPENADVDRLPSFITGAQPVNGGYEGNGHQEGGGGRYPRRRRRPHGPRHEGRGNQPSLPSEDFSSGE